MSFFTKSRLGLPIDGGRIALLRVLSDVVGWACGWPLLGEVPMMIVRERAAGRRGEDSLQGFELRFEDEFLL